MLMNNEKGNSQPKVIELVPLTTLSTESQLLIRDIRNEEGIRKWMYSQHIIELNEHLHWLSKLRSDASQIVFAILDEDQVPQGIASVSRMDMKHKSADWAFYLTSQSRGGLGSAVEYAFINFVFDKLNLQKLNCEVLEGNKPVLSLHKKFSFYEEGFRRSNIVKSGTRLGVHLLGLTRADWRANKQAVEAKLKRVFVKFSVSIQWNGDASNAVKHPLDQIESARARNNLNWMNVLRLVLELSPTHGLALVKDIRNIDKQISELTDKLISSEQD